MDDMLASEDCMGVVRNLNERPAVGVSKAAAETAALGGDVRLDVPTK
jgi:hypothetical protein